VIEQCGGTVGVEAGMRAMVCATEGISETTTDAQEIATVLEKTKDRMMATGFIMGADESRYRTMILEFENSYTMGVNKWPNTLTSAHRVLANWKGPTTTGVRTKTHGVSFNTDGGETEGKGPRCWYCNEWGHLKRDWTKRHGSASTGGGNASTGGRARGATVGGDANTQVSELTGAEGATEQTAEQLLTNAIDSGEYDADAHFSFLGLAGDAEVTLNSVGGNSIPSDWILLDNQSTVDVFCNAGFLTNLRVVPTSMRIRTQAGEITTNMMGDLSDYGPVWYCKEGIANILSLNNGRAGTR
jgi:hypothetical protein